MNTMPPNVKKYYRMLYLIRGEEFDNRPLSEGALKNLQDSLGKDDRDYIFQNVSGWFDRTNVHTPREKARFTKQFLEQIMEE